LISLFPSGTGNGLAESLVGCKDVLSSTLHIVRGNTRNTNILGSYCEDKLIGYSGCIFGTQFYADILQISQSDGPLQWMGRARALALPFLFLLKPIPTAQAEVTVYSNEIQISDESGETIEKILNKEDTFKQESCASLIMPWAIIDEAGKFCVMAEDHRKDEFYAFIYAPMGKIAMMKHLYQIISRKDNVLNNTKIKKVTGYAIRMKFLGTEDEPEHPGNHKVSVDGELMNTSKPDYYVRLITGLVSAYSSK